MISLSFVEFNQKAKKPQQPRPIVPTNTFSFMTTASFDPHETKVSDVTEKISLGKYNFKTQYTILFLYDFMRDDNSRDFIRYYGARIHNRSALNVTILTYFTEDTVNLWRNVQGRESFDFDYQHDANEVMDTVNTLKDMYHAQDLPAMVVIKKEDDSERSFTIDVSGLNSNSLFEIFNNVITVINDNCEASFDTIRSEILQPTTDVIDDSHINNYWTYEFVANLVRERANNTYNRSFTQEYLAVELGISVRQLRNKRTSNSFTRDECLIIAILFQISPEDLDRLLRFNDHVHLGLDGRDGIINRGFLNHKTIEDVDDMLIAKGYEKLSKFKD